MALNKARMGTGFLTQGSNKRSIALNLKTEGGREALKRLVKDWADVFVENYRPGAFKALGLGYEDFAKLNPKLVYASMTAFGQDGPRGNMTAYDHAIQATSGITASHRHRDERPDQGRRAGDRLRGRHHGRVRALGRALPDAAHRQRPVHRHGDDGRRAHPPGLAHHRLLPQRAHDQARGQQDALPGVVDAARRATGWCSSRRPTRASTGASTPRSARRPKPSARSLDERYARYDEKQSMIAAKMKEKTAQEWEDYFQSKHVPATRVRELQETLQDPQLKHRGVLHRHENVPGVGKPVTVPLQRVQVRARRRVDRAPAAAARASTPTRCSRRPATARTEIAAMRKSGAIV